MYLRVPLVTLSEESISTVRVEARTLSWLMPAPDIVRSSYICRSLLGSMMFFEDAGESVRLLYPLMLIVFVPDT